MSWLLESLRVVRDVRDWAASRPRQDASALGTRSALQQATSKLEEIIVANGGTLPPEARIVQVPRDQTLVKPLGPSKAPQRASSSVERNGAAPESSAPTTVDARIAPDAIDGQAVSAVRRLQRYGYTAYLVGGCVRDLLLGISPKDFDIATDARPEEVKAVFRNSRIIGRRFRLVHLYFRGGKMLEVATFRASIPTDDSEDEGASDLLIRRDNVFGTEKEDAERRDFTINALFYEPQSGSIIDHVGGLDDIDAGVVRMIGDPDIRLREDPVRILRAIRFRAKAGLTIEPSLEEALGRHVEELARCAPARLLEELLKLLRMGHARPAFDQMLDHGVVDVLLPEVQAFLAGHLSALAGAELDDLDPIEEVRAHLDALDALVAERGTVSDDVVLGALLYPMVDAVMAFADERGKDRNRAVADLLSEVGARVQVTRRLSEQLRQLFSVQRHFPNEDATGGRRRRRVSTSSLLQRGFFEPALRLFEVHVRATEGDLDEVAAWEAKAAKEGRDEDGSDGRNKKKRRRGGRRRRSTSA